jgi:hypothetical protein
MIDEARLRKIVEKRIKTRQEFVQHFAFYLMANTILWGIWVVTNTGKTVSGTPWAFWITVFWGVGLVIHFFQMLSQTNSSELTKEMRLQKEIDAEREKLRRQGFTVVDDQAGEKPKRHASISDDGELEYEEDREHPPTKIRLAK